MAGTTHYTEKRILSIVEQTQPGTFNGTFDAAGSALAVHVDEPGFDVENEEYLEPTGGPSFDKPLPSISKKQGSIRGKFAVKGAGGAVTDVVSWDRHIKACGFDRSQLESFTYVAAGTTVNIDRALPGTVITQASSGATGILVDVDAANLTIWIMAMTGDPDATGDWTGTSSQGAFTIDPSSDTTTVGNIYFRDSAGPVRAQGTLTTPSQDADAGTFTIGSITYRIMDTPAQAYDIARGADVAAERVNIVHAINGTGTAGVHYFAGTLPNPHVTAAPAYVGNDLVITAKVAGTAGHVAFTETLSASSMDGSTLLGGTRTGRAKKFSVANFQPYDGVDSTRHALADCVGNIEFSAANVAQAMIATVTLQGTQPQEAATTRPTAIPYEPNSAPVFNGVTMRITGVAAVAQTELCINQLTIRAGNNLVEDECATAAGGLRGFDITGWSTEGEFNPRLIEPFIKSFFADFNGEIDGKLYATLGSAVGNRVTFLCPRIRYTGYGLTDENGKVHQRLPFKIGSPELDPGDNSLYIVTH